MKGRGFTCSTCPKQIQKLRRCREDKWDFTEEDGGFWPIQIQKGGNLYSFCPGKATWDFHTRQTYDLLVLSYETKQLLYSGGIAAQPAWFIELLTWFGPRYDEYKFYYRAKSILGGISGDQKNGGNSGRAKHKSNGVGKGR